MTTDYRPGDIVDLTHLDGSVYRARFGEDGRMHCLDAPSEHPGHRLSPDGDEAVLVTRSVPNALQNLYEILQERIKVSAGVYGPDHDAAHGYLHLAGLVEARLLAMRGRNRASERDAASGLAHDRRAWVEIGQFALAALEVIDSPADPE